MPIDTSETNGLEGGMDHPTDTLGNAAQVICEELDLGMVIVIARVRSAVCMRAAATNEADAATSKIMCEAIMKALNNEEVRNSSNDAFARGLATMKAEEVGESSATVSEGVDFNVLSSGREGEL